MFTKIFSYYHSVIQPVPTTTNSNYSASTETQLSRSITVTPVSDYKQHEKPPESALNVYQDIVHTSVAPLIDQQNTFASLFTVQNFFNRIDVDNKVEMQLLRNMLQIQYCRSNVEKVIVGCLNTSQHPCHEFSESLIKSLKSYFPNHPLIIAHTIQELNKLLNNKCNKSKYCATSYIIKTLNTHDLQNPAIYNLIHKVLQQPPSKTNLDLALAVLGCDKNNQEAFSLIEKVLTSTTYVQPDEAFDILKKLLRLEIALPRSFFDFLVHHVEIPENANLTKSNQECLLNLIRNFITFAPNSGNRFSNMKSDSVQSFLSKLLSNQDKHLAKDALHLLIEIKKIIKDAYVADGKIPPDPNLKDHDDWPKMYSKADLKALLLFYASDRPRLKQFVVQLLCHSNFDFVLQSIQIIIELFASKIDPASKGAYLFAHEELYSMLKTASHRVHSYELERILQVMISTRTDDETLIHTLLSLIQEEQSQLSSASTSIHSQKVQQPINPPTVLWHHTLYRLQHDPQHSLNALIEHYNHNHYNEYYKLEQSYFADGMFHKNALYLTLDDLQTQIKNGMTSSHQLNVMQNDRLHPAELICSRTQLLLESQTKIINNEFERLRLHPRNIKKMSGFFHYLYATNRNLHQTMKAYALQASPEYREQIQIICSSLKTINQHLMWKVTDFILNRNSSSPVTFPIDAKQLIDLVTTRGGFVYLKMIQDYAKDFFPHSIQISQYLLNYFKKFEQYLQTTPLYRWDYPIKTLIVWLSELLVLNESTILRHLGRDELAPMVIQEHPVRLGSSVKKTPSLRELILRKIVADGQKYAQRTQ